MNWDFYPATSDLEVTERRSVSNRHMDPMHHTPVKKKKKKAKSLM